MVKMNKGIRSNRFWVLVWSIFFLIVAAVIIVVQFSQSQTKTGTNPEELTVSSLTCESDGLAYPFLTSDGSTHKSLKVVATFSGGLLRTISLQQMLYYNDAESIRRSETENHAAMNISFGENELDPDSLEANYATLSDGMRFGIYGVFSRMKLAEFQYFLLGQVENYTYDYVRLTYEGLGMTCSEEDV